MYMYMYMYMYIYIGLCCAPHARPTRQSVVSEATRLAA